MRILFDQSAYDMRNKGNNALLEVAILRLREFWPDALLDIITLAPNLTRLYYPFAQPVSPYDLQPYSIKFWNLLRIFPRRFVEMVLEMREELSHRRSTHFRNSPENETLDKNQSNELSYAQNVNLLSKNNIASHDGSPSYTSIQNSVHNYDLIVASGGGYFCDSDKHNLLQVLNKLEIAAQNNIPTVMVSQGIGPLNDPELRSRAAQILPKIDLICVRETKVALPILRDLGLSKHKIEMTGDDAIELVYGFQGNSLGNSIGVSLRITSYTKVGVRHVETIKNVIQNSAEKYKAALVAIPISSAHHESDITCIKEIFKGYKPVDLGLRKLDSPTDSIKRVRKCRIVITGTFHGAVFALAQGIPVIGLANTDEYFYKLAGLSDEFGKGCQVLSLQSSNLENELQINIDNLWKLAEELKPELLAAAERQIKSGYKAYKRIFEIVTTAHARKL
jgi:Uncharacterized conserved protein